MKKTIFIFILFLILSPRLYAEKAKAELKPTSENSKTDGTIYFEEMSGEMHVTVDIKNATPGNHAVHIHENGSCDDGGKAAGKHFNPDGTKHGFVANDGLANAHAGDFGNIIVNEKGEGHLDVMVPGLKVKDGKYAINGKAFIVHEKQDSFEQPDGKAGSRIACGIIKAE